MNRDEYRQLVDEYGRGFEMLSTAALEVPRQARAFKPAPREWSVNELLAHMADSETIGATRLYMIIAMPGSTLMSYDDNQWADALSYPDRNIDEALQLFRLLRQTNRQLLGGLPEAALQNSVIHPDRPYPEYGETYNVEKWLRIYTRHVRDHVSQLQAIHQAWKEKRG